MPDTQRSLTYKGKNRISLRLRGWSNESDPLILSGSTSATFCLYSDFDLKGCARWFNFELENQALWFGWLPRWAIHLCDWFQESVLLRLGIMSLEAGERVREGKRKWERETEESWKEVSARRRSRWLLFLLCELPLMRVTLSLNHLNDVHPEVGCPRCCLYQYVLWVHISLHLWISLEDLFSQKQQWPNRFY